MIRCIPSEFKHGDFLTKAEDWADKQWTSNERSLVHYVSMENHLVYIMGKPTIISMAMFKSYVKWPDGISYMIIYCFIGFREYDC